MIIPFTGKAGVRGEERRLVTAYRRGHREPRLERGGIPRIEHLGDPGCDAPQDALHRAWNYATVKISRARGCGPVQSWSSRSAARRAARISASAESMTAHNNSAPRLLGIKMLLRRANRACQASAGKSSALSAISSVFNSSSVTERPRSFISKIASANCSDCLKR